MRHLICVLVIGLASVAAAQTDQLALRHARILDLHVADDHAAVIKEVELQLMQAEGTQWQDSIYRYTYILGRAVWKTNDADAGIAAAERIIAVVQRADRNAVHKLDAMDDRAKLLYGMGRMLECARADSASLAYADAHREVPLIRRGKARQRLALDYSQMGDYERSLKYYREAKAVYEKSDTLLALLMGDACSGIGSSYWHLGELHKAEEQYKLALSYLEKSTDPKRNFRMAGTLTNIGILWQSNGDFSRSKANYLEAIRRCAAVADTARDPVLREEAILGRTRGYVNLATVYFAVGDDGRSRELLEMALRDRQLILEPDDPKLLGVKDRLADLEIAAGNYGKAEGLVRAYLEACEKYYGANGDDYIRACAKLGEVHAGLGQDAKADSLFRRSITLSEALGNAGTNTDLASAYRRHANFYYGLGRYDEAIAELKKAIMILERVHGDMHTKAIAYDLALAQYHFENKDPLETLRLAEDALALLQDRVRSVRSGVVTETWPQPYLLPDALYWKVKAQRALGMNVSGSWGADMDLSVLAMQRNKAAYDDEGSQLGFIGQQKAVFDLAIDLAGEDYEQSASLNDLDRFLTLTEADRSILLKSRLNEFSGMRFAGVPDSIITRENQLISAVDIDPDDRALTPDLAKREKELADFLEGLSKSHPQYFALRYGEPKVNIGDLRRKLLTPERDLLIYAITGDHLHIMVVGADTAALIRASSKGITEAVTALNATVIAREQDGYIQAAHHLYQLVFAHVAHLLKKPELLIIPDGDLHTVNFETLLSKPDAKDFRKNLLIQRYAIAYLLSATTAVQFADMARERSKGVLAIAPGFSDAMKQDYLAHVPDSSMVDRSFLSYVRQPFAVNTAQDLGASLQAKVMVGGEANEKDFRAAAKEYGILHLGTHAEMNATTPMYSRLVLSKDGQGVDPDADGYLHAYEIYELDLRAQLAVLTACQTGTGKNDQGEGVRSLGYSFAYAGCPSLVMSLWSIDEKTSSTIIASFYELLADGLHKHEALRQAKLDYLATANGELALPYYWAGLVLVGDVEPVELGTGWPWAMILGVVALLVIGVLFFVRWRKR
ncbi:MAG: CHAT domain-containing protein [Flavobacteriales bacterium]